MGEGHHLGQLWCENAHPWWMPGVLEGVWEVLGSWLRLPNSLGRGSLHLATPVCAHGEMTKPPCRGVEGKQARPAEPRWCRILILHSL